LAGDEVSKFHRDLDSSKIAPRLETSPQDEIWQDVVQRSLQDSVTETRGRTSDSSKEIAWSKDLSAAYKEVQRTGKPLVVAFTADWCAYCKSMENFIFPNQKVQEFADKAVFFSANPEKDPKAEEAAKQLNIDAYPTLVILELKDGKLQERTRIKGYHPLDDFVDRMGEALREKLPTQDGSFVPAISRHEGQVRVA
jgi:thiol:disulfide interchange protein